jgi:glycosyltransferase involved in cell wall biosynthesis
MTKDTFLTILHGYHLDGSGSCIYVQSVVRECARRGRKTLLLCQEPDIEKYDFVSEAYRCGPDGALTRLFRRDTGYDGEVIHVRPYLAEGLLPVFVDGPFPGFDNVKAFSSLSDAELTSYIETNTAALLTAAARWPTETIFANHIVMTPVIARRACRQKKGLRYFLIPHGSEIEYLIKKDKRYLDLAIDVLDHAAGIVSGSEEMNERIAGLFPGAGRLTDGIRTISVGVDAEHFGAPLKKSPAGRLEDLLREAALQAGTDDGPVNAVDEGFVESLDRLDPEKDTLLLNFGKMIPGKGVQDLLVVAPLLLAENPRLKIVLAGDGPHRGFFSDLVALMQKGDGKAFFSAIEEDNRACGEAFDDPYRFLSGFFDKRSSEDYFRLTSSFDWAERILFAGYLRHAALRHLLCLSSVAVFPSIVKEAYPLALLEAMATGVFPIASDFGGLKDGLIQLDGLFPREISEMMRIPMERESRLEQMKEKIAGALAFHDGPVREAMVRRIGERCSWKTVCTTLLEFFDGQSASCEGG